MRDRLYQAINVQGGRYLKTPRDVNRALNALRLHAVPVCEKVDLADMVWLQLARIGSPALYAWVEEYLSETSAVASGAIVHDHEANAMDERLTGILEGEEGDPDHAII
jgi:hypothetical protein